MVAGLFQQSTRYTLPKSSDAVAVISLARRAPSASSLSDSTAEMPVMSRPADPPLEQVVATVSSTVRPKNETRVGQAAHLRL